VSWIRRAAASLGPDPSEAELAAYARASGFSSATVLDDDLEVIASWGIEDRALHIEAAERSQAMGGPRVAGTDDADRADMISVSLPYLPGRHVAASLAVGETAVDWYLKGLASTLGAEVALVDEAGVAALVHAPPSRSLPSSDAPAMELPAPGETLREEGDVVAAAPVAGTPWRLAITIDEARLHRADPDVSRLPWLLVGLIVLSAVVAVALVLRLDTVRRRAVLVEAEYRRTVDRLQEGLMRTSLRGEVEMANAAALRLLGFDSLEEAREQTDGDLTRVLHPDDAVEFRRRLAEDGAVTGQQVRLARAGGRDGGVSHVSLSAQVVHDPTGRARGIEGLIVDVTERHRIEEELRRRDLILQSAASAASTLLREADWEAAIAPALETIGLGADVERVFVFGVAPGEDDLVADYLHEWVAEGVDASIHMEAMHDIPIRAAGFERWIDVLSAGGMIVGDASSFPESEQGLLAAVSARSLLVAPIVTRDGWWGFVGFAHVTGERSFSTAEADAIRMSAEVIAAAVDRSLDHAQLQEALSEQELAAEALRVAGQVRDDFLSMVSHELRTPLTPILGFSHLLERPGVPQRHRERGVVAIRRNARRMLGLVDDLLVYSRASSGQVGAVPSAVDLEALLGSVLDDLDLAGEVDIQVAPGTHGWIDEGHLGHVVTNLVTNAMKYGDGRARIEAAPDGPAHVVLRVVDEGPGVPPEFVPQLFDRFTQASTGDRRTATGTGLGLAIVRLLTQANGAEVRYRPNQPTGSCFEVRMRAAVLSPSGSGLARQPETV
ncbi:MAG: PAS domain S-box protein, partial [Actinobacteria bacterium]|nr:PAS domain S-box protein [Actinomycetota bacterium]